MIELNLLPDLKKDYLRSQKQRNRVVSFSILVMIVAAGLVVLSAFYTYGFQTVQLALVNGEIKDKSEKLKNTEDISKYLTIQNQLNAIDGLHETKPRYSRFMEFLPVLNPGAPNNVQLTSLQVDEEGKTVTFTGNAPTYESLGVFKATLENAEVSYKSGDDTQKEKLFTNVAIENSGISTTSGGAKTTAFTIRANYSEQATKFDASNVQVTVPNIAPNAQDTPVFRQGGGN